MALDRIVFLTITIAVVNANIVANQSDSDGISDIDVDNSADAFKGVYTECLFTLSYRCLQKKTLLYLEALNNLNEVSVVGDYVKFVKLNVTDIEQNTIEEPEMKRNSDELSIDIDNAVNKFLDSHILHFKALGKDIAVSHTVDEFVGRKKRKGGGGGGGGGHDDGKKKMMMMAMMCMKMKMMMMIPAMMGMMGMMSFKGMMFSMMSFMISKMMLLMKILEKKGGSGGGGGGGGGGDGWAAGGGGGAWMPAGGQDYGGGGGGGGYDANGQWQSRSIIEAEEHSRTNENNPVISYVTPLIRYNNNPNGKKPYSLIKNLNNEVIKANNDGKSREKRGIGPVVRHDNNANKNKPYNLVKSFNGKVKAVNINGETVKERGSSPVLNYNINKRNNNKIANANDNPKSRKKRGIIDVLHNTYLYWINQVLGGRYKNKLNYPKYKIINGVKYVYYPLRFIQKAKKPKVLNNDVKTEEAKTVITAEDFNKGEIVEGPVESRMHKKKLMKMKDSVSETVDDNPWE